MKKSVSMPLTIAGILAILIIPIMIHAANGWGGTHCPAKVPPFFAEKYDADNDGKLSAAEEEKAMAAFMEQYDTDKDGTLSREEHQAFREEGRKAFFEKADTNNDGVLSQEEFEAAEMIFQKGTGGPGGGGMGRGMRNSN